MRLSVEKADAFVVDFEAQFAWYAIKANWDVAERFKQLVQDTVELLALRPALGRTRQFRHRELRGIRSHPVQQPFEKHLVFYRFDDRTLIVERLIHGARDLPRRLRESPGGAREGA